MPAIQEIVPYPHPALRWKSKPVTEINADLRKTVEQMFALMYEHKGIGLAANQVALPWRVFILNLEGDAAAKDEELVFINPEIIKRKGSEEGEEGCLSFPGLYGPVKRAAAVIVEAFDLQGNCFEYELDELAARAVQHEYDHLDGVLFIDRMADSIRREHTGAIHDLEVEWEALKKLGTFPPEAVIKQQLQALEQR